MIDEGSNFSAPKTSYNMNEALVRRLDLFQARIDNFFLYSLQDASYLEHAKVTLDSMYNSLAPFMKMVNKEIISNLNLIMTEVNNLMIRYNNNKVNISNPRARQMMAGTGQVVNQKFYNSLKVYDKNLKLVMATVGLYATFKDDPRFAALKGE